jgi:hypothetical protein
MKSKASTSRPRRYRQNTCVAENATEYEVILSTGKTKVISIPGNPATK